MSFACRPKRKAALKPPPKPIRLEGDSDLEQQHDPLPSNTSIASDSSISDLDDDLDELLDNTSSSDYHQHLSPTKRSPPDSGLDQSTRCAAPIKPSVPLRGSKSVSSSTPILQKTIPRSFSTSSAAPTPARRSLFNADLFYKPALSRPSSTKGAKLPQDYVADSCSILRLAVRKRTPSPVVEDFVTVDSSDSSFHDLASDNENVSCPSTQSHPKRKSPVTKPAASIKKQRTDVESSANGLATPAIDNKPLEHPVNTLTAPTTSAACKKTLGARLGMRAPSTVNTAIKPALTRSVTPTSISRPLGMRTSGLFRPISFPPTTQSNTPGLQLTRTESVTAAPKIPDVQQPTNVTVIKKFKPPTFKKAPTGAISQHNPNLNRVLGMRAGMKPPARPLHDPDETGALVLWRPAELSEAEKLKLKEDDKLVAVVVDPTLSRILRPHQIDGVIFMYECVTGLRVPGVQGCIMADEMGLGKTLQCITLLWTLLRQSPVPGKPVIDKCIIVCPSSLVRNWANEIVKWLGANAVHPLCADNKGSKIESTKALQQFVMAKGRCILNPILIISYESLRLYAPTLGQTQIGLMLCDEGHRLKNPQSQTFLALNALNIPRRVILSGTPIQNDLTEYFSLLTFACPGLLGSENEFRRNFQTPINRGRDADASDKEQMLSNEKLEELVALAGKVQIRRTQDLLRKYLPTKQEHVVFCQMMPEQLGMYTGYLQSPEVKALLRGKDSQPLKAIGYLKKLVNHPCLVEESRSLKVEESGKLVVLDRMLHKIKTTTRDKIVLVSNYTQTLDVFERLCSARGWGFVRLDGTLVVSKRQKLVDQFNDPAGQEFIFLLSSKAGGCGINLIGANRLVLFDPDWNPASDMQALARIWRDGQKKECFIYRFIATGTIEEKIFQRQCHKQMLSNCVVDEELEVGRHFSVENLRLLFEYNANTLSDTHDTFKCKRCVNYRQSRPPPRDNVSARNAATDMSLWNHYSRVEQSKIPDPMLRECGKDVVTFVFHNETQ